MTRSSVPRPRAITLLVLVAGVCATRRAESAEPPDGRDTSRPCRPTVSCTAEIVAPGTLEVETGAAASKLGNGSRSLTVPFLLKQSVTPQLQLQLGSNGYTATTATTSTPPARYLDNVFVGPKLPVLDQGRWAPALAVAGQWSIPTLEAAGYSRNHNAFFTGFASKDVGPIHFDLNVGANVMRLEQPLPQAFGAFAASASLPDTPFGAALEVYAFSDASPVAARDAGVRSFVAVSPRPWWVFDVGGDVGLVASTRAYSLFLGMTFVPVILFRPSAAPPAAPPR
jgi:hypothetical protein